MRPGFSPRPRARTSACPRSGGSAGKAGASMRSARQKARIVSAALLPTAKTSSARASASRAIVSGSTETKTVAGRVGGSAVTVGSRSAGRTWWASSTRIQCGLPVRDRRSAIAERKLAKTAGRSLVDTASMLTTTLWSGCSSTFRTSASRGGAFAPPSDGGEAGLGEIPLGVEDANLEASATKRSRKAVARVDLPPPESPAISEPPPRG